VVGTHLRIYEYIDGERTLISYFPLPLQQSDYVYYTFINETDYVIVHSAGAIIVNVADIMEPIIIADIRVDHPNSIIISASYYGDYLALYDGSNNRRIWIYQKNVEREYILVGARDMGILSNNVSPQSIYIQGNYLFHQCHSDMRVFDLSTPNFNEVYRYGNEKINTRSMVSLRQNDCYYFRYIWFTTSANIYSALDNELVVSIPLDGYELNSSPVEHFTIEDDKLYLLMRVGNTSHFEIWDIAEPEATMINYMSLPHTPQNFIKTENHIFFETYRAQTDNIVDVFSINDDQLVFLESLYMNLGQRVLDFIITTNGNTVSFRDSDDYQNVMFSASFPHTIGNVYYFEPNYLVVDSSANELYIYKYNLLESRVEYLHTFPTANTTINIFNGIITDNAYNSVVSQYYTVLNDEIVLIGEKEDRHKEVLSTYFFPERHKMVQVARSGLWAYDIAYEEYVSESDVVVPVANAELHGNYPNPFNPTTTIAFEMARSGHVTIEVYNIRGQKVRTLVSGEYGVGSHKVVWNGDDFTGRAVGSGMYFYRMTTAGYSKVNKMVLLK